LTETNVKLPAKYYKEGNKIYHEKPGAVTNGTIRITEFHRRIIEKGSNPVVIATFILPESDRETIVDRMFLLHIRACLKIAFCKMCFKLCGRFGSNLGGVAGYID